MWGTINKYLITYNSPPTCIESVFLRLDVYTHVASKCKLSKANDAEMLRIQFKPSYSKSKFYNTAVSIMCLVLRAEARKPVLCCNTQKVNNNYLMLRLALLFELGPEKDFEVTWVYVSL